MAKPFVPFDSLPVGDLSQVKAALVASQAPPPAPVPVKYDRKQLGLDTKQLTGRMTRWLLEGDRLETMLADTKFRDIMVSLGIATDKMLLLEGQPTQIIGQPQQAKLDQLSQALATAMKQRGIGQTVTLTERTATVNLNEPGPSQ
jgi:hypothetical protein